MSLNCLTIMRLNKIEYTMVDPLTGEVATNLKDYYTIKGNISTDKATINDCNINLTAEQVLKLRPTTRILATAQATVGITAGILLGKGIFTGTCIAIGTAVIADMATPTDFIYNKVLNIKPIK